MAEDQEEVQKLADSLKSSGLAASMTIAIEKPSAETMLKACSPLVLFYSLSFELPAVRQQVILLGAVYLGNLIV